MSQSKSMFWSLCVIGVTIPFFTILYHWDYNKERSIKIAQNQNPYMAFGLLLLSILLWLILFNFIIRQLVVRPLAAKNNLKKITTNGTSRVARILDAKKTSKLNSSLPVYEIELSFKNLANTDITQKTSIVDTKPNEKRFEKGKDLTLFIDKDMKTPPYFFLDYSVSDTNMKSIVLKAVGIFIFISALIFYYFYSYQTKSNGMGWRFLSFEDHHPLLLCPTFSLILIFFIQLDFTINRIQKSGVKDELVIVKFKGLKTTATIINAEQMGADVSKRPAVDFQLEFTDEKGRLQEVKTRKVIDMVQLNKISHAEKVAIFYLPENPKKVAFVSEL